MRFRAARSTRNALWLLLVLVLLLLVVAVFDSARREGVVEACF